MMDITSRSCERLTIFCLSLRAVNFWWGTLILYVSAANPAQAQVSPPISDLFVPTTGLAVGVDSSTGSPPPPPVSVVAGSDGDAFEITFDFAGLTPSQEAVFETAAAIWDLVITGYQTDVAFGGVTTFAGGATGPVISAGASDADPPFDGPGGTLGVGGVGGDLVAFDFADPAATDFVYAQSGFVFFDLDDIPALEASGQLLDVAVHEIGHVLGIGTLWDTSGISFVDGAGDPVDINGQVVSVEGTGQYTGEAGVAAFNAEFVADGDPEATFVPVELEGGPGTADAHFDETGAFTSNITDLGLNLEILTGFLSPTNFLSTLTAASLEDIGFTVDPTFQSATLAELAELVSVQSVPEPTGVMLLMMGLVPLAAGRRRC